VKNVNQAIRVAVANQPRLMRELLLATITDQPDIEIVAEIQNEADIPRLVEETAPEFLIIALDSPNERPSLCDSLLRQHPKLKIVALDTDGNCSVFYSASFDIHATELEASESGILNMLRSQSQVAGG
jgi:DNA-binding NarL/FixJ family response regulator